MNASVGNVEKGSYPLMRELNLITKDRPTGLAQKFIEFVGSQKSIAIIKEHFFVPAN